MPRSMARPTAPATRKASGSGDRQRPVEQAGERGADDVLHDEGGVGAEHHHLAMRHVDDAHDAEGDGEADRREQQHRAERQAVPDVLRRSPQVPASSSDARRRRCRRRVASAALLRSPAVARSAAKARHGRRARRSASIGRKLVGFRQVGLQHGGRARQFECGPLTLETVSLAMARVQPANGSGIVGLPNIVCGGGEPDGRVRRAQRQRTQQRRGSYAGGRC